MEYKFQYTDVKTREAILSSNGDKILVEEQVLIEGSFLIYADAERDTKASIAFTMFPETELSNFKQATSDTQIKLDETNKALAELILAQ